MHQLKVLVRPMTTREMMRPRLVTVVATLLFLIDIAARVSTWYTRIGQSIAGPGRLGRSSLSCRSPTPRFSLVIQSIDVLNHIIYRHVRAMEVAAQAMQSIKIFRIAKKVGVEVASSCRI
jgi:hypothetical protein